MYKDWVCLRDKEDERKGREETGKEEVLREEVLW